MTQGTPSNPTATAEDQSEHLASRQYLEDIVEGGWAQPDMARMLAAAFLCLLDQLERMRH